ncbi:MAG: cellobiose phosphorylase, partial [Oscillospiraceae bacterium]|nr:cellobiose phosphorylase [Oscillospiraceae bacterium]
MDGYSFTDCHGSFTMGNPNTNYLYFPLASERGLKSAITPNGGGDAKINQTSFLLEPVSVENLHNNRGVRNFWCRVQDSGVFSALGASDMQEARRFTPEEEPVTLNAGFMWHSVRRAVKEHGIDCTVTTFIPWDNNVEVMAVTLKNASDAVKILTPCAAIPIYGRSADNLRDHRHVTSLLHRIQVTEEGVLVKPTMSFDERGHQKNERIYYVLGASGDGEKPVEFFPTVENFIGEGGSLTHPRSVLEGRAGVRAGAVDAGKEAMGAFAFKPVSVSPGEEVHYIVLLGAEDDSEAICHLYNQYNTWCKVCAALGETKQYWLEKVNVSFKTDSRDFDNLMNWVCFQPFLRRLFGCSFLPYHDYGRGGRGWRDLWQDCLSLLIMDPQGVGEMIEKNFGGVRMDGTNATIIGDGDGNFIADRNGIARVWMDHALWPLMTTKLYIDQTGDLDILLKKAPYFKDRLAFRGTGPDEQWEASQGSQQRTAAGDIYQGTILEHLLIQNLTAFYEVGDHNLYRLRGADWNDALDMAAEKGESVAFTCAYAGNLRTLAELLLKLEERGCTVSLPVELLPLMGVGDALFEDKDGKQALLDAYCQKCLHTISGELAAISPREIAEDLLRKADWLTDFVREQEWIDGLDGEGWFNSYYDNHGQKVEGYFPDHVRMMLTGQVFSIMGGVATDDQIRTMTETVDRYLYDPKIGGYRLNTDFHELKMDMGRMFGFAYGEKENGAVFCHMAVMYANALYRRGFAREGWKVLSALADTALDFETSRMYPGIPEYFRGDGRGMYPYLTGA